MQSAVNFRIQQLQRDASHCADLFALGRRYNPCVIHAMDVALRNPGRSGKRALPASSLDRLRNTCLLLFCHG